MKNLIMELPDKIKIGPFIYSINRVEGLHSDGQKLIGRVLHDKSRIDLESDIDPQAAIVGLLREAFQVLRVQAGLPYRGSKEDNTLTALAFGWVGVFRDNLWPLPLDNNRIKIGPLLYTFKRVTDLHDQGSDLYGMATYRKCLIEAETALDDQQATQTVLHEICHVIKDQSGLPYDKTDEEFFDCLTYGLLALLQDNPWLLDLIGFTIPRPA